MEFDGLIDISIGKSRHDTNWKHTSLEWSELVKRLSKTQYTHETVKEYHAAKKDRQDEIKDVGGFVGGIISGGRRLKSKIISRSLITLDLDFVSTDFWTDFQLLFTNAAVVYSTHKHVSDSPRLRLIMPLATEVLTDEYEPIARRIAGSLGIDQFDHTSFQHERLMYWPSTPANGQYLYHFQDGEFIDPVQILNTYRDWRDSSQWPLTSRETGVITAKMKKAGDPLQKPGALGAFCRAFSIQDAIDRFLSDVYVPGTDGRYSYINGSTSNGLVIYDDKFAFSHHGTDPTSGKLCNAWDLIRLHKFLDADEHVSPDTPINRLPSNERMGELANQQPEVRLILGRERMAEARAVFGETYSAEDEGVDWIKQIETDAKGTPTATIGNILYILQNDPALKNRMQTDLFTMRRVLKRPFIWDKRTYAVGEDIYFKDADYAEIRNYLEKTQKIASRSNIQDAIDIEFTRNSFHPVRDYLNGLTWDGVPRINFLFIDYLGAEENEYVETVTRKFFIAAVARIFRPGVKFDYVLTLVGEEGRGKSTVFAKLAGRWFSDSFGSIKNNKAAENIQGFWIVEIGELADLRNADVEETKLFISKTSDTFRPAFGKEVVTFKRQGVFVASTNEDDFLRGHNGNRRFWPVRIDVIPSEYDFTMLDQDTVNQMWAEAVQIYRSGEELHLSPRIEAIAKETQTQHTEIYQLGSLIDAFLETRVPEDLADWYDKDYWTRKQAVDDNDATLTRERQYTCAMEIWTEALRRKPEDISKYNTRDINAYLKKMKGWRIGKGVRSFGKYGRCRYYERI